ncbi:MAG: hypothetical protein WA625_08780, partial [Pseudolabrys sp.]
MMSALPPKADISWHHSNVRFVPKADIAPHFCVQPRNQCTSSSGQEPDGTDEYQAGSPQEVEIEPAPGEE